MLTLFSRNVQLVRCIFKNTLPRNNWALSLQSKKYRNFDFLNIKSWRMWIYFIDLGVKSLFAAVCSFKQTWLTLWPTSASDIVTYREGAFTQLIMWKNYDISLNRLIERDMVGGIVPEQWPWTKCLINRSTCRP